MNSSEHFEIVSIIEQHQEISTRLARLIGGGGSGATACFAAAKRTETSGAEDLPQDIGVSPGKARHALEWAAGEAMTQADEYEIKAAHAMQAGLMSTRDRHKETEAALRTIARILCDLMPKPDSEARNERSGRRNASLSHGDESASPTPNKL